MSDLDHADGIGQSNPIAAEINAPAEATLSDIVKQVSDTIAPVWPLKDYVAVNPYFGIHERKFMDARAFLKVFSDCETLMPVDYYAHQYQESHFDRDDVAAALSELSETGLQTELTLEDIVSRLEQEVVEHTTLDQPAPEPNPYRCINTIAEVATKDGKIDWIEVIRDEISKTCAAHYDDGQASWRSPWKELPLFEAWRSISRHDRSVEALGLKGFRDYVQQMPETPVSAILYSLERMNIPRPLWPTFLMAQAFSIPGWSAWAKYQDDSDSTDDHFVGLLAMRLTYDAVLSEALGITGKWDRFVCDDAVRFPMPTAGTDSVLRYVLLRASELGFRNSVLDSIRSSSDEGASADEGASQDGVETQRKLGQMVFCIDVRSERIRRRIETVSRDVETYGFAGFFGLPLQYNAIGEPEPVDHLPVLLKPQFKVMESQCNGCGEADGDTSKIDTSKIDGRIKSDRVDASSWRKLWRGFQTSAVGCFSFVETTGSFFGLKLLGRVLGWHSRAKRNTSGLASDPRDRLGPTIDGLEDQGIDLPQQIDLVENMLTNLGLKKDFAKLVVFCGHASQTENNPLAAGLDCGACGGHSGEPNARFAALLANRPEIRLALRDRGISIPDDTYFLGAVHNTTTDDIKFFDIEDLPQTLQPNFHQLRDAVKTASLQTREERLPIVASRAISDLMRRAGDWSEVRPEWGLAGNAAFIVGPRSMTKNADLDGRSFLHSYDYTFDPEGKVLELIMTAPMIVANWINMQYYASTVDNHHFGSGNKTVHNVVGRFGLLSGNGGDLKTGLPWQSLHTGGDYQHLPLRLQVVIVAPRTAIDQVIEKHELVASLITNGWLHLIAIEADDRRYRFTADETWKAI